jgi:hypothetical protein
MTSPLELEIRSQAAGVLSGAILLRDFYNWFIPATLDIDHVRAPESATLTYKIIHLFAELSSGDITPREFKQDLRVAASTYVAIHTPWNPTASVPAPTTNANDIIEEDPAGFVLRKRHAAAVA